MSVSASAKPSPASLSAPVYKVSSPLLLSLYGIIPVCFLIVLFDYLFFGLQLRDQYLPSNPATLIIWAIVFNFPHITSSLITLADDEYIPFYKQRFQRALAIIVTTVIFINIMVPLLFPGLVATGTSILFFIFFATYTMYHVLSQQFGIGMMLMKAKPGTPAYERWRWFGTIGTTFMYAMVFGRFMLEGVNVGGYSIYQIAQVIAGVFVLLATVQGFYLTKQSQRELGSWYVYSNIVMLLSTYALLLMGYGIFVIAIPRFVHDLTAFIIYSVHDQNRNREVQHNYIYRHLSFLKIPPLILCAILAIVVANTVECGSYLLDSWLGFSSVSECALQQIYTPASANNVLPQSMQIWMQIMFICGFFHYYIESFVWKREAIHRHSISFS